MKNISMRLSAIFIIALFCNNSFSQVNGIKIGETCPDVMIPHIINYKTDRAGIADFKGKLLILDFWATWCGPCVSMLPVTDSLQKQFAGKIQILAVTDQDAATVTAFFKNMKVDNNISMASVTDDKELAALFPHVVIPHYVWLDEDSKVLAITGAEEVTADVITGFLNKKGTALLVKADDFKIIDDQAPMFVTGNNVIRGNRTNFEEIKSSDELYHSVITKHLDGFGCEQGTDSEKITCKNSSVGDLYRVAAGNYKLINIQLNGTIWETANEEVKKMTDSAGIIQSISDATSDAWLKQYTYCYELKFPDKLKDRKFNMMLGDLNNYFGAIYNISGGIERRKIKCLALIVTNKNRITSKTASKNQYAVDEYHLQLKNAPVSELLGLLSINLDRMPPLIDETGDSTKLDIDLHCKMRDVKSINNALASYGLQLVEKIAERDMIVIKDKPLNK